MRSSPLKPAFCSLFLVLLSLTGISQTTVKTKFANSNIYAGIEVGSKGVKISILEIGKNAKSSGAFHILKDSSVNTDFISFTPETFSNTLNGLVSFYQTATKDLKVPSRRVFTVVSSGVRMQADKNNQAKFIYDLIDSFRLRIQEPDRQVDIVDVREEGRLSHLGIVPESRRYTTFLIDIGSGNAKGGFFPNGNTKDFRLFQLNWGTKSTTNAAEKRLEDDKSLVNYLKQLSRVLQSVENSELAYAVNASGAYPMSDNIAVSGGIAWAVATVIRPDLHDQTVVPVTYKDLEQFFEKISGNYGAFSPALLVKNLPEEHRESVMNEIKRAQQVFDQRSFIAGTGLLLRIMRQFESVFESKQYFLVKNGHVGWVSAYVDETVTNK
jgi:hypothetical protein